MNHLATLQRAIEARAAPDRDASFIERLCVTQAGELAHLDFYGDPFGESFGDLLEVLGREAVANSVASIDLRGPDEGSNGTRNWDLTLIAECDASFPRLRRLSIELTRPTDHNKSIVAQSYDEDGVHAKILAKAPNLEVLITPSAPNADFFRVGLRPIRHLSVDVGYDHQQFIANFARASCFPDLRSFEFGDYNETCDEDFSARVTPLADYREFFISPAFASVRAFRWRNPVCSPTEIAEFKILKENRQVQVVR